MKLKIIYILSIVIGAILCLVSCDKESTDESAKETLYDEIDREIENVPEYDKTRQDRIGLLKEQLAYTFPPEMKKEVVDKLISEYEAFISDSALYYVNLNLGNPLVKENKRLEDELIIKKADIAAHAGLFGEANDILASIDATRLDSALLGKYYSAYCDLYQYQIEYAENTEYARLHEKMRELYIDSVAQVSGPNSLDYIVNKAAAEARSGNFRKGEMLLLQNLDKFHPGERPYSILSSILADLYKNQGDKTNFHKYISLAAISDIKGAIKENMALRALATECFEEGDFERADRYLRQSFYDANFYSARMRNAQSSRMLPIIGEAYNHQQKSLTHKLRVLVVFLSISVFGLILISIFAFVQVRKIRKINRKTEGMLEEVSALTGKLREVNSELSNANKELQNSNKIKGEYGALFMEYSALAISSLQKYQQSLKVAAAQGNMAALIKKIESTNIESKTLAEFYDKFDEAILNIYPQFIEKFNRLLRPEYRFDEKEGEKLNTELRIYALIRIGINDSEKIAKFLRCSLSTVYTYRSKTKKKAINPETFEADVINI